jgi:trans-L-3-hydroxyproline dehydratase
MTRTWTPPETWTKITTLDLHTAGEPLRIITGGFPDIPGETILAKRQYTKENLDHLRKTLMWEPRGHADMYGCLVTEPVNPDSHLGVLFLHNEGFSSMCGHGIIALSTAVFEYGLIPLPSGSSVLRIDTPAGLVEARPHWEGDKVRSVSFINVPSFVYAFDHTVEIPDIGKVTCDVTFGGAYYAVCPADGLDVRLEPEDFRKLIDVGIKIKKAVQKTLDIRHPYEADLGFLYGTILTGASVHPGSFDRNVCIFADGEVDRSPTGTGVSARAALLAARKRLTKGEEFTVESILGTRFTGKIVGETTFGPHKAVIPEVRGSAAVTGRSEFWIDPDDPLKHGFLLR